MKRATHDFYMHAVRRALARLVQNLDDSADLTLLAKDAALSPFHFHRVFRGMVGETPLELVRRLRLERAAHALAGEQPITQLAFAAGYETHEAFTRAFRARYGASPQALRAELRDAGSGCARAPQLEIAARSGIHVRAGTVVVPDAWYTTGDTNMDVRIEDQAAQRVFGLRHTGAYPRIAEAFARLGAIVGPLGLHACPGSAMVALYHDDPEETPEHALRSDAGIVVPEGVPLPEGLHELRLPAGRYAITEHRGPYSGLGDTWSRFLGDWLPRSGERAAESAASYERYLNTPMDTQEDALRTEIHLPLADRPG